MRLTKWYTLLLLAGTVAGGCRQGPDAPFSVKLKYAHADQLMPVGSGGKPVYVYLEEVVYGKDQTPVIADSVEISGKDGAVILKGKNAVEGIYEVVFGQNALALPLINDSKQLEVTADLGKKTDFYSVTGSIASGKLQELLTSVNRMNQSIETRFQLLDSLNKDNAPDSVLTPATIEKDAAIASLNDYLRKFLTANNNATLGVLALSWASRSFSAPEMDSAMKDLNSKFPGNPILADLEKNNQAQQQAASSAGGASWIGKPVPDFSLPDVNGKDISLASFKGKYLLVDFWASWCGPCRMENPNVLAAYNQFKSKNFTILGVSLDKEKEPWVKAIEKDKLAWTQVSDLKYWNSKAVETFGFQGIPFNILVGPDGTVVAQELRGPELVAKLNEVLK